MDLILVIFFVVVWFICMLWDYQNFIVLLIIVIEIYNYFVKKYVRFVEI